MRKPARLSLVVVGALFVAACLSAPASTPTATPRPSPTPLQVAPAATATKPPAAAPTTAAAAPTATNAPAAAPTTAAAAPTATNPPSGAAAAGSGISASDAQKLIDQKLSTVNTGFTLWNIQPGLGTVMIEYGQRFASMYYAAAAANWDMAKYQRDEMLEIQEVGETTRPARAPLLKAFEDSYLKALDDAILAKDSAKFTAAFNNAINGCNACHSASSGSTWKSYQYVHIQPPKADPAFYVDWKGGGQDNYVANPPAAATAVPPTPLTGGLDAAGAQKLLFDKLNTVDRNLGLWNIQPGLGTVMMEYANRWSRLWFAAHANNWDMAKYQHDEMLEIQEVGETTRPARAPLLKGFEDAYLSGVDKAIAAKDLSAFEDAFKKATDGCNACHKASTGSNWKSYQFVKVQVPAADNNDYIVWNAAKGTGSYVANPPAAPTATPVPRPTGPIDVAGFTKMISDTLNAPNRSLALWDIQPGLGTVMIEYANRMARLWSAISAGNWDMAKYQHDEMLEVQEVGETTRPARAPLLKAFEDSYLKPLDDAILAKDNTKAQAAFKNALQGCNSCHAASSGTGWSSYGFVQLQQPQTDPATLLQWSTANSTGNYINTGR